MSGGKSGLLIALTFGIFLFGSFSVFADPIGQIDTVGMTWHDEQWGPFDGGSQIARDSVYGNIYVVWTMTHIWNYWVYGETGYNFYRPQDGWAYGDTGINVFPGIQHYGNHSILLKDNAGSPNDIEIIFRSNDLYELTRRAWWDTNYFESASLDTLNPPSENSPLCTKDRDGKIHILAGGVAYGEHYPKLFYGSYYPDNFEFSGWELIDTLSQDWTYCLAASPVSDKVAFSYFRRWRYFPVPRNEQWDNNVFLISSPNGSNWSAQERIDVTDFAEADPFRAEGYEDIIIDYNDDIHIAFSTQAAKINRNWPDDSTHTAAGMYYIWHWSDATDSFSVAADGWIRDPRDRRFLSRFKYSVNCPHMAINPSNGNIYLLYERYSNDDIGSDTYGNADQWVTVSTDGGLNWSEGTNITDTHTPYCYDYDCSSEIEASLCNVVNDTLHIVYILDKSAGIYERNEGPPTQNYVIYQKIPASLIPTTPLIEQFSIRQGPPDICPYLIGDINGDSLTNGSDVTYAVNYFLGRGSAPMVSCACSDIAAPFFGGGDVNGNCVFNGMDVTFYVGYLKGRHEKLRFCYDCPPYPRYDP
jgi:hypothetical protein